jgi:hypothetical protein
MCLSLRVVAEHLARTRARGAVEAVWVVVCKEDGAARVVPSDHAKEDAEALFTTRVLQEAQHKTYR